MDTAGTGRADRGRDAQASYVAAEFFLLRAPALPIKHATTILQECPVTDGGDAGWERPYTDWVRRMWQMPQVRAAVSTAAPDLARAVEQLDSLPDRDRRRATASLGRYLNRMSVRPTPFGLMAGVAVGTFRPQAQAGAVLGTNAIGTPQARPDMGWLLHLSRSLTDAGQIRDQLEVRANDLVHEARGRVWLPNADAYGASVLRTASIRLTAPVRAALRHAEVPVAIGRLRELLTADFPAAAAEQIASLIGQLVELDILMTACRPQLICAAGDTGLIDALAQTSEPAVADAMRQVKSDVAAFNRDGGVAAAISLDDRIRQHAKQVTPDYRGWLLQIDSSLQLSGGATLPSQVRTIAEVAANVLTKIGATYQYPQSLRDYASAFTERYGAGAEIGVLEVLCAETGLGPPAGYQSPPRQFALDTQSVSHSRPAEREEVLSRLVASALAERSITVELDDKALAELADASGGADGRPATPGIDVHLQLIPPDGEMTCWRGVVAGAGVSHAGRTAARFYHLLDHESQLLLQELAQAEEERTDGLTVELTYLPSAARAVNVSVRPPVRQWELPVNVTPSLPAEQVLSPRDVLVGVRDGHLYLRSARLGHEINVSQHSMLSPLLAPNFCRFLIEVSGTAYRGFAPFQWGNLDVLMPFLPRLVWQNVIIKRARWRLRRSDFRAEDLGSLRPFAASVQAWADTWLAPRFLYLTEEDNHILIDTSSAPSLEELRQSLARADSGWVVLEEALPAPGQTFLTDTSGARYAAEVVIPVLRADRSAAGTGPAGSRRHATAAERFKHIGSDWLYAKLYTEPDGQDQVLLDDLPALAGQLACQHGVADPFYIRYGDPAPHLRIRFQTPKADHYRDVLGDVTDWAGGLLQAGRIADFTFATYHREIERYGGPELIAQAEHLFGLDSRAARELLGYLRSAPAGPDGSVLDRTAFAALSLERIGSVLIPALDERRDFVRTSAPYQSGGTEYRAATRTLWECHTSAGPAGEVLQLVDSLWRPAGECFADTMDRLAYSGELWSTRREIVASLLHLHCNRLGLGRTQEETAHGIWRRLLDRIAASARPVPAASR